MLNFAETDFKIMTHLIVTATKFEAGEIISELNLKQVSENIFNGNNKTHLLISGVGVHTTIFELTKFLNNNKVDLIINTGIAGAFKNTAKITETFLIKSDYFGDLGYYDNNRFINIFNSDFNKQYSRLFTEGKLILDNNIPDYFQKLSTAHAITVNIPENISQPENVFIESMEGAAVMMCAKLFNTKCVQIRAVSNIIGETPRNKWKIKEAIKNYSEIINEYINLTNKSQTT